MCNDYRLHVGAGTIADDFSNIKIKIRFPEGTPNIEPRDDIKITDTAPIVRTLDRDRHAGELVQRRWSWPGHNRRPVYNFRSENREFSSGRCLIIADGFYEFTNPKDPKKKRKDKWLFTKRGEPLFCIAGICRSAPYHDRQIAILDRTHWADWLDPSVPARPLLTSLPAGMLAVKQVG